ncbi:hypothetical protein [Sinosporangium siamense]|uniref:Uncharacterized protein n=1 Tax=Sinosporangium siamense TaxID=1367973 RepID=A0A919VAW1_9ACTN|nr:hypothetical protein [Sinosporangium siamense]GII96916.1 hypothetical protein Ssi02_71470 [Sinosporangium siamense]
MNTNFEERLISAVMEEHARRTAAGHTAHPGPVRHSRVNRRLTRWSAVAAGAAAVTMTVTLFGGGATSAYAVTTEPDGSVRVQINEFRDSAELEAELADAGVKAVIDYLPANQTCQQSRGEQVAKGGQMKISTNSDGQGIEFEIPKGQIGAGETLVLAISVDPEGAVKPPVATIMKIIKGPVAPCEATALPLPSDKSTGSTDGGGPGQGNGPSLDYQTEDQPAQRD